MVLNERDVNTQKGKRSRADSKCLEELEELPLTKRNLKMLQQSIFQLETKDTECPHFLCGYNNVSKLRSSRMWFLFELEMSFDGYLNLRNSCYFSRVYQQLLPSWTVTSCLSNRYANLDPRTPDMPIGHILISNDVSKVSTLSDIGGNDTSVEIESLFHDVSSYYIPPSMLHKRRKLVQFTEYKLDIAQILNETTKEDENMNIKK